MRSNNPFQILADDDDDNDMTDVASNCSPRSPLPNLNPINLPVTPPKRRLAIQPKRRPAISLTIPTNTPTPAPTGPPTYIHDLWPTPSNSAGHKTQTIRHQLPIVGDNNEREEEYPTSQPTTAPHPIYPTYQQSHPMQHLKTSPVPHHRHWMHKCAPQHYPPLTRQTCQQVCPGH